MPPSQPPSVIVGATKELRQDRDLLMTLAVLVEDDGLVREAMCAYLEELGCEVRAAGSAEAALVLCRYSREIGVPVIHKPVSPAQLQSIVERARG